MLLALVMLVTSCSLSLVAYAVDDYTKDYTLQIYYYNENKEFVEVTDQISVMEQYDVQLYACLVYSDGTVWNTTLSGMPVDLYDYTVDWTSDARYLAFCEDNDGKIHGYDATKGEAIRNWLDNEVGSIPVVGGVLKNAILKLIDNGVTDIDNMDTEDVTKVLDKALASINVDEETRAKLTTSLANYLNKFDVGITATLRDGKGKAVASDTVRVLVTKSDKLLSDVVPNAAFIKNYDSIPRKVAVGYEMDLDGIITPVRTHYKCEWTVTGSAGILGSDLAEVDENGHFVAKGVGKVQVKVSPDIKGLTSKLREAFEALSKAGDLVDSDTIAKAILLILGIPANSDNYTTLVSIITAIIDSGVVDGDGAMGFTDNVMTPLANFILYVIYQDAIDIEIVSPDAIPITSYNLSYDDSITEGESTNLKFTDVKPDGAVAHDYKLSLSNEEYAVFTDTLTVLGIDGSTWNSNYVTPNKVTIQCEMDTIKNNYELKVYGKDNKKVVYIKINCSEYLDIGVPTPVNAVTYPKRLDASLQYGWVMSDGTYRFATADTPAYTEDGETYVTSDGVLYSTGCTVNDLVVKEKNGAIQTKQIMSGVQTTGVKFTKKHFWTKSSSGTISTGIRGSSCEVSAYLTPADASFNKLTFTSKDTESVILSAKPLTTAQYTSAALTEARRAEHATVTVEADENGYALVYAYAIGNTSCYADIEVASQTGGFVDYGTVAFANISVTRVDITSTEDDDYLIDENFYQITAGDTINFEAHVRMSEAGSWKNQGFEDVEWTVSDDNLATLSSAGVFVGRDVGTVTVTATSVFGEVEGTVTVKILPDYRALKKAIADCDYENLDPYDWSEESWDRFDAYYNEAVEKLADNSFVSQHEVDELTENIIASFNGLVRYMPLTGLSISCNDDADGNGFATIDVPALSNYTKYSTTIVPTIYPEGAEYYHISYKSSDESKLRVTSDGICVPVSDSDAAWARITVTVTDPKNGNVFSQEMYVAFAKYQVTSVTVDPTAISFVGIGADAETKSAQISATFNTSSKATSASIKYGFFVSSDEAIATVDRDTGVVTPVGIGQCTVTCYSYDGGYTGVTTVNVTTNKNKLRSAISRADSLVEEFYTEDSYANVQSALAIAKSINADESALQQDINDATVALEDALSSLVRNPYANVYISAGFGGAVMYDGESYTGDNNKVRVLIEDGLHVTAVSNDRYHFIRWVDANGNTLSTNESETFTIDYSAYFKAEFEEIHSVAGVTIFADGNDTRYYTKNVSALANYTKQSVQLSYNIAPANANFYTVRYSTDSTTVTLDSSGKLTPAENSTCYAVVDVVVTNTITGEQITDTVTVAFVKYAVASVSATPSTMDFEGVNAPAQNIEITYSASSSSQTPSLRRGFYECSNTDIAIVDSNGAVYPRSIGSCVVKLTSYDGGYTATVNVNVHADKSALRSAIANANAVIERNFTADSYLAMKQALQSANEVNNTAFASQTDVDSSAQALQEAINNLVKLDLIDINIDIAGDGVVRYDDLTITESSAITLKFGAEYTITASANADSEFVGWFDNAGNRISTSASYTAIAGDIESISARFAKLIYITDASITYEGNIRDYVSVNVSTWRTYTSYSVNLGYALNPSSPSHYTYSFSLGADASNLKLEGDTVSPNSNSPAYGTVYLTVLDQSNGRSFTDTIVVAFANNNVTGISLDDYTLEFEGATASSQNVTVSYQPRNASVAAGFVTVKDDSIAQAYVDGGNIIVTPRRLGSTIATFTSYDGGYIARFTIDVYADKSALSEALTRIKSLNAEDYTEDSFASVAPVVNYAESVYDDMWASQEDVDATVSAVNSVITSLVLKDIITIKVSSVGNGYATINGESISSIRVTRGDKVTISAVPNKDYMIDAWYDENGNIISHDQTIVYDSANAISLIAKFKPIPYIDHIAITYNGNETDFATVDPRLGSYTNASATFDVVAYPADAKFTVIGYSLESVKSNLSLTGSTVKPVSNNPAYGQVNVTVRDEYSGKTYTDVINVCFAKTHVASVTASPSSITFDGTNAPSQTISVTTKGATSYSRPNVTAGFFVSDDENVATVSQNGVVTPTGKGSCVITYYCYDNGVSASTSVKVTGNPDIYGRIVAMNSPLDDSGTVGVAGAIVSVNGVKVTTDDNGYFVVNGVSPSKTYKATIEYQYGVTRQVTIAIYDGDKHCADIPIIAVDYDRNGYINARDYVAMKQKGIDNRASLLAFLSASQYSTSTYIPRSV